MNIKLFLIMGVFLLLVGCKKISSPYIEITTPSQDIIKYDETYALKFFVYNPTINTFVGSLNYTYAEKCLYIQGSQSDEIEISPNTNKAIIKEFSYKGKNNHPDDSKECYQQPLKVSVFLSDKSGLARDNKVVYVTITK